MRVPFHRQSFDFTCGPASLIMVMRYFDPGLAPGRELEIDIWREANLIEAYATSHYGLALAAYRRGFRARTEGNAGADRLLDCMCRSCRIRVDKRSRTVHCGLVSRPVRILDHRLCLQLHPENRVFALSLLRDLRSRCRAAGIPNRDGAVNTSSIREWLGRGWLPIVLVDARLVGNGEVPHWTVVTGCRNDTISFQDPLSRRGGSMLPLRKFERFLGFHGTICAVVVEGKAQGPFMQEDLPAGRPKRSGRSWGKDAAVGKPPHPALTRLSISGRFQQLFGVGQMHIVRRS
jgi:hypothetical protein